MLAAASPIRADTDEQNRIEAACLLLLARDYARYGALPLIGHFDAYLACGVTWWVSWLPERAQGMWWKWQYERAIRKVTTAR